MRWALITEKWTTCKGGKGLSDVWSRSHSERSGTKLRMYGRGCPARIFQGVAQDVKLGMPGMNDILGTARVTGVG